jgi:serine/threonine protein kinase
VLIFCRFTALDLLTKLLSFDPAERITVREALAHPWLATYHNTDDEPECTAVFERWKEIEKLETLEDFKKALWGEIQDYRREVRGLESSIPPSVHRNVLELSGLGQITEEPRETSRSVSPAEKRSVEQIREIDSNLAQSIDRRDNLFLPSDTRFARSTTPSDPVVTYARRSSIMQPPLSNASSPAVPPSATAAARKQMSSFSEEHFTEDPAVYGHGRHRNTIAFPSETFVVPARSRTASLFGGEQVVPKRLLRTLSTVSIHESGEGLAGGLADIAPIGKYIVAKNTEDEPVSEIPKDFEVEGDGDREQPGKGFHIL